jgi:glycine cleavage system aminomethyltransferase T
VIEAGLGFAVDFDKPGGFIGRDALLARRAAGPPTRRLVQVLVRDPDPLMFHAEIVHRDGRPVGYMRSASYGHTLGGAVGLAMIDAGEPVDQAYLDRSAWEVDIAGVTYPAVLSIRPFYDPQNLRVRG